MTLTLGILLLALAGLVLLVAETFLPTQGLVGAIGAAALAACVVACFRVDSRLGFAVTVAMVVAAPFAAMAWVKLWPKTPVGRRMILAPAARATPSAPAVQVGMIGVAVSELRPMGVCDFGAERTEARAERGTIPAGQQVRVVDVVDGRPTVRVA